MTESLFLCDSGQLTVGTYTLCQEILPDKGVRPHCQLI